MKEYNDQLMKFKITNDKLKMEIKLSDLVWLFRNSPDNVADDGEHEFCRVIRGKIKNLLKRLWNCCGMNAREMKMIHAGAT